MGTEKQRESWRKANKKYRDTNPNYKLVAKRAEDKRKFSDKRKQYQQDYLASPKGRAYILRRGAIHRAKKYGYDFDLPIEWVYSKILTGICEVTGIPFVLVTKETYGIHNNIQPFSPCIDRINSNLGYTMDNCRIVVNIFNQCKMHWSDEDVQVFVKAYYERNLSVRKV